VPDPSFSSLYVVSNFPSMLFSYFSTTSLLLPLLFSCLNSAVGSILLIVHVLRGEFSSHPCSSHRLSSLEVTRGLGENGNNFLCNVGATQPIGIFLPLPSRKSMQMCVFHILPPSRNSTQLCGFSIFDCFCYGPCNGSPPLPPSSPIFFSLHPSFPSLFGRVACQQRMWRVPCIHLLHTRCYILCLYP